MRDKIAMVCQRYGLEVNGGSELYCRQLAEQLSQIYDVEIYTTCALDYITWENYYSAGEENINGVLVHRFPVTRPRNSERFRIISEKVLHSVPHTKAQEDKWIQEQGPVCDKLLRVLSRRHKEYKAVIFMTYLYYLTARGLPMNFENALLIPTVHDEPPVYLQYYEKVFYAAKGIIWNTVEERAFAENRFPQLQSTPGIIAGVGIQVPEGKMPELPEYITREDYILYAGRIDQSKGCSDMFRAFRAFKNKYPYKLKLVLIGKPVMEIPQADDIISLGFVSEEMKFALMQSAKALILFSQFESLSMVVLESMIMGRPVLVNGKCAVLKGHCIHSNAGLYFENDTEFEVALNYLLTHPAEYRVMCKNGRDYVKENYQWDVILKRIISLIESL